MRRRDSWPITIHKNMYFRVRKKEFFLDGFPISRFDWADKMTRKNDCVIEFVFSFSLLPLVTLGDSSLR